MIKTILCFLIVLGTPSIYGQATDGTTNKEIIKDDVIVIVAKTSGCIASDMIQKRFRDHDIKSQIQKNNQIVYIVHGDKFPKYLQDHKIKWYPTIIRFKRSTDGYLRESNRFVGIGTITSIPQFLSDKKRIMPRQMFPRQQPGGS